MGLLPEISWTIPDFFSLEHDSFVHLGAYDNEAHIIHLNYKELIDSPLLLFTTFMHELLHHVFSPARNRGKIDLDNPRWRFFNWDF